MNFPILNTCSLRINAFFPSIDKSLKGWKEVEYEVVRDAFDNCITVSRSKKKKNSSIVGIYVVKFNQLNKCDNEFLGFTGYKMILMKYCISYEDIIMIEYSILITGIYLEKH